MNINYNRGIIAILKNHVQHYDHVRYWKCREKCIVSPPKCSKIIYFYFKIRALIYLWYVKRCDAFNCASTGADLFAGAQFKTPPRLPHGLNGIIINPYAKIGANCKIFHQDTIGDDGKSMYNAPIVGDNVIIGAGAKLIGKICIGNNVFIGAGAIVVTDIPDNAVVVGPKASYKVK